MRNKYNIQLAYNSEKEYIDDHIKTINDYDLNLIKKVAEEFNIQYEYIFIKRRYWDIVIPRFLCFLMFKNMGYSLIRIGNMMSWSEFDHTTIIHGIETIQGLIEYNSNLKSIADKFVIKNDTYPKLISLQLKRKQYA